MSSHEQLYKHICRCMQNHNDDTIKTSDTVLLEKFTSHFIWKGSKGILQVLLCERWVGGWTELQHIDPKSYGHNSVSFPFSWAAQLGAWGPNLIPVSFLQLVWTPTDWTSCAPSYIIIWRPLFFLRASQFRTQFNRSTVKVISWYSSTGCTWYLHRCIFYFDSLAGVNML